MNEVTQPKLRFSLAAQAAGCTPKALRHWMQRDGVVLFSEHRSDGWTDFNLADVTLVLPLMKRLIDWGISINRANEIAFGVAQQTMGMSTHYRNTPADALFAALKPLALIVWRDGDSVEYEVVPLASTKISRPATLIVSLGLVAGDAMTRLEKAMEGGARD